MPSAFLWYHSNDYYHIEEFDGTKNNIKNSDVNDSNNLYADDATVNPSSNEVVLGYYFEGDPSSYDQIASAKGATYFQLDNWDQIESTFGHENMWKINQHFLDKQWNCQPLKDIYLTHNPWNADDGKFFGKEVLHLMDLGAKDFTQVSDTLWKVVR